MKTLSSQVPCGHRLLSPSPYYRQSVSVLVIALLNRLRAVLRLLPLGPATVSDDSADGFQQPVPRHRRYNYSVHHERESSSFSGLLSCKVGVDSDEQLTLQQFYPFCYW